MKTFSNLRARHNLVLFSLNVIYIFVIGLFQGDADIGIYYRICISLIFLISIASIKETLNLYFAFPVAMILLTWLADFLELPLMELLTGIISAIFFFVVIVLLVIRVAQSKEVSTLEFLESINVYLLLGISASLMFSFVSVVDPHSFRPVIETDGPRGEFIYFAFVTMTTLGYGDLVPVGSLARSLAIFFSVAGQLYLTMIIAMLVGKYLNQKA